MYNYHLGMARYHLGAWKMMDMRGIFVITSASNDYHLVSASVLVWVVIYIMLKGKKISVQSYVTLLSFIALRSRRTFPNSTIKYTHR